MSSIKFMSVIYEEQYQYDRYNFPVNGCVFSIINYKDQKFKWIIECCFKRKRESIKCMSRKEINEL